MAKNKILRWMRMFIGAYDLSGDARTFSALNNHYGEADMAGWSDAVHWFLADGHRVVGVKGFQAFLNDAAAGAFGVLKESAAQSRQLTTAFGSGAEPTLGDPAYILGGMQISVPAGFDGNRAIITADFEEDTTQYSANGDNPWGLILQGAVSLSATTTGSAVDNGAASTAGGHANLHVLASSGGTWSLKVQHSPDNSAWSDLITFTANGSAITSEHKAVSSTVNRYLRVLLTRTSGTVTVLIAFARN